MDKKTGILLLAGAVMTIIALSVVYSVFIAGNVKPAGGRSVIYIPKGSSFEQAMDSVCSELQIRNEKVLFWLAIKKKYPVLIKPGRYVFEKPVSYNGLIDILRSGRQSPVRITFSNIRTINELAGKIAGYIEADSIQVADFLSDTSNYSRDGFRRENVISVFIPDTYELYWNTDPEKLYRRMLREYKKFWNSGRLEKCESISLSPLEVSVLASIVDEEALIKEEKQRIAGVYLNRLKGGIPLQSDPTIKFAVNDFTIRRILYRHLQVDSPYNTYRYAGLPPGPICCPSIDGIDAVLNAEKHNYLYFAARADFSGYHNFSRTLTEHNRYANQYQKELNKRKIFR